MYRENGVRFTNYAPIKPLHLVSPSWDMVIATPAWGWTVGTPPTAVEFWLTAGTYTLNDFIFISEINNDPSYLPACKRWVRPPQTIVLTPGMTVTFGEPAIDVPPPASSGFVEDPTPCLFGSAWTPTATATATAKATPTATPKASPTPTPTAAEEELFSVTSIGGAYNGATEPTTFSISESWLVTEIYTYHWNNAQGKSPGTVGLKADDGTVYGPWQATGQPGQGGVPDAYWVVKPNIVIPPGTYTVLDSDPSTWAQNAETGGAGMSAGKGIPQ
jgi:hypothetical protein